MKLAKRILVTGLVCLGLCALTGCTDKGDILNGDDKVYKIGITQIQDHKSLDNCRKGFVQGLENKGFIDGQNIEIEFKSAQGDMNMNTQIAQQFASGKDLVCGIATASAQALYSTCYEKGVPVIFNAVSDPVIAKLAVSTTENMKGVSGVSDLLPVEDQLKLIRAVLPDAKKIGIIYTTGEPNSVSTINIYKELAPKYGFEIVERGIVKQPEVTQALDVVLKEVDCISNMTDNTVVAALSTVLDKANEKNIPVFGSEEEQVVNGCIASAGIDYISLGEKAGEMAADVLNGTDVTTIPYATLQDSKITVNKSVAQKFNIEIPQSVLDVADIK